MRATTILISVVVVCIFVAGFTSWFAQMSYDYGNNPDLQDVTVLNKVNETYNFSVEFSSEVAGSSTTVGQQDINDLGFNERLWRSIRILFKSMTFIPTMITDSARILGIPDYITFSFLGIVLLSLTIGILALIGIIPLRA